MKPIFFTFCLFVFSRSQLQLCILSGDDCDPNAACGPGLVSTSCVCNLGYTGSGTNCSLVNCGQPPVPAHAAWDDNTLNTTYNSTWTFDCLPPYGLNGTSTATCGGNGNWTYNGTCVALTWNGVVQGDISGNYTNGCSISNTTLGYLMLCPNPQPAISYLNFYQPNAFTINTNNNFAYYYGGVNYFTNSTVKSIWIQTKSNVFTKGTVANLVPVPRVLKYSGDHQPCVNYPISMPIRDFQRCASPLQCYFMSPPPQAIGAVGQCWYPTCDVSYCAAGARFTQNGYCHNITGGGYECVNYLPAGSTGCGGYNGPTALYPACDPFTSFCVNGTCVYSPCLDGGCEFGNLCTLSGSTATCSGQNIPGFPVSLTEDLLGKVIPALPLSQTITLQSYNATDRKTHNLLAMTRTRAGSSRRVPLLSGTPCNPTAPCLNGNTCSGNVGTCSSPPGVPCYPNPC